MRDERWLPVVGLEGLYEVSDLGRVRSLVKRLGRRIKSARGQPRILVGKVLRNGYREVLLTPPGEKRVYRLVHNLVLLAFVGPRPPRTVGCHWSGDKSDNSLTNLRWDAQAANCQDNIRLGVRQGQLAGVDHVGKWLEPDDIRCIRAEPAGVGVAGMLARAFGIGISHVRMIRARSTWKNVPDNYLQA